MIFLSLLFGLCLSELMYIHTAEYQDPKCTVGVKKDDKQVFMTEGLCDVDYQGGNYFGYFYDQQNDSIWYFQYCDSDCRSNCELVDNRYNGGCYQYGNIYQKWDYTKLYKGDSDVYTYFYTTNDYTCALNDTKSAQYTPGGECQKLTCRYGTSIQYYGVFRCNGNDLEYELYDNEDCTGTVYGALPDDQNCVSGGGYSVLMSCTAY